MPPLPAFRVGALRDLAAQLRFGGRAALLRQVERAEALAAEIEPGRGYAAAALVRLLTGYAPRGGEDDGAVIPGEAVLADLSTLAEHLTMEAGCTVEDLKGEHHRTSDLMSRWGVSRKTIERYRRRGLIARRIGGERGRGELAFTAAAVAGFEARLASAGGGARGLTRIGPRERATMVRRAGRYRRRFRCTLNGAAARLAARFGRSHEAVRQVLAQHDAAERRRASGRPIFDPPARRDGRARMAVLRALRGGAEAGGLTGHLETPRATARRVQHLALTTRARLLGRLDLSSASSPLFARDDAAEVVLSAGAAVRWPAAMSPPSTLEALLEAGASARPEAAAVEAARAVAMLFLLHRARAAAAGLRGAAVRASVLDAIETDLRWSQRLRVALLRGQVGVVMAGLSDGLGSGFTRGAAGDRLRLLAGGLIVAGRAIDTHTPFHGARLAATVGLSVSRWAASVKKGRAAFSDAAWPGIDRLARSATWGAWLLPPRGWRAACVEGEAGGAWSVVSARFGLGEEPPRTLAALAATWGVPLVHAAVRERRALSAVAGAG